MFARNTELISFAKCAACRISSYCRARVIVRAAEIKHNNVVFIVVGTGIGCSDWRICKCVNHNFKQVYQLQFEMKI